MYLTIAGNLGSGKSTICKLLSEKYEYEIFSTGSIQRKIANEMNISTLELNQLMFTNPEYDDLIDKETVKISKENTHRNIIFDSRMAWHFVEDSFDIFTVINPAEAAKRVIASNRGSEEVYKNEEEAETELLRRAAIENKRFKEIYYVDNFDYNNYNFVIDTTWSTPEYIAEVIFQNINDKEELKILLSPKSLYPTKSIKNLDMDIVNKLVDDESYLTDKIEIVIHNNYYYVVNGHHKLVAALLSNKQFVPVKLVKTEDLDFNLPDLTSKLKEQELREYEKECKFNYKNYPKNF